MPDVNLPTLQADKANHLTYGAAIGAICSWAAVAFGHPEMARVAAIASAGAAGALKELLDAIQNRRSIAAGPGPTHDVDIFDLLATLAGGVLVSIRA
jgi:hypothetical protein